jgi:hypothetical protein
MSHDDAWHVRIPQRLRASVDKIAVAEDRHPAQVVRRLLTALCNSMSAAASSSRRNLSP